MDWHPVQGVPYLVHHKPWDRFQVPRDTVRISGTESVVGWKEGRKEMDFMATLLIQEGDLAVDCVSLRVTSVFFPLAVESFWWRPS